MPISCLLNRKEVDTVEYYINGFSSSLPLEVQINALRKVKGLENVEIFRPGYAIEYDFFQPTQLKHTLETKAISEFVLCRTDKWNNRI